MLYLQAIPPGPEGRQHASRRLSCEMLIPQLLKDGLVSAQEAAELERLRTLQAAQPHHEHPLVWLAERRLKSARPPHKELTLEALTQWLADTVGLPYLRIDPLSIDVDKVTDVAPKGYAGRYGILPVEVNEQEVTFATAEPLMREWEEELQGVLRRSIRRVIANPLDIARYQQEFYGLSQSMTRARKIRSTAEQGGITNLEALVELGRSGKLDANDHHVVTIVDWLLQYAFDQRASDIHLEPRRENSSIRFRIDGNLHTVYEMPAPVMNAVTARIKALGRMDIIEKRRPQDGRLKTKTPLGREVEMRLSTMPTAFGEKMVMRIFDPEVVVRTPQELGFSPADARQWRELTAHTHGIILVTGPTGSGKTTTLYSTLKSLARPEINLCTIEDPIEMIEPAFNQMQVNPAIGVHFASGVRTLLRQDPDIIMVGEIRDLETAQMAIQAALTGHLVFSTLHTNDAPSAVTRLLDLGVPPFLINASILGIVAQRLVRTLCPHCKAPAPIDAAAWRAVTDPWKLKAPPKLFGPKGCIECRNSGFHGRIGLYEILRMTPDIRALIRPDAESEPIRQKAAEQGLEPLRISGARKILSGLTTVDEVLRVTPPPGAV